MNRERRIEQLEFELAERGADILELRNQLAEARAEIEKLKQELRDNSTLAARQIVPAEMLVDDLAAEAERKDALIEQMREALRLADNLIDEYASGKDYEHQDKEVRNIIKAALEAAERMKKK